MFASSKIITYLLLIFFCISCVKNLEVSKKEHRGLQLETRKYDKGSHYYITKILYDSNGKRKGKLVAIDRNQSGCMVSYKKIEVNRIKGDTLIKTTIKNDCRTQKVYVGKNLIITKELELYQTANVYSEFDLF